RRLHARQQHAAADRAGAELAHDILGLDGAVGVAEFHTSAKLRRVQLATDGLDRDAVGRAYHFHRAVHGIDLDLTVRSGHANVSGDTARLDAGADRNADLVAR